jgi:hypothetical protein
LQPFAKSFLVVTFELSGFLQKGFFRMASNRSYTELRPKVFSFVKHNINIFDDLLESFKPDKKFNLNLIGLEVYCFVSQSKDIDSVLGTQAVYDNSVFTGAICVIAQAFCDYKSGLLSLHDPYLSKIRHNSQYRIPPRDQRYRAGSDRRYLLVLGSLYILTEIPEYRAYIQQLQKIEKYTFDGFRLNEEDRSFIMKTFYQAQGNNDAKPSESNDLKTKDFQWTPFLLEGYLIQILNETPGITLREAKKEIARLSKKKGPHHTTIKKTFAWGNMRRLDRTAKEIREADSGIPIDIHIDQKSIDSPALSNVILDIESKLGNKLLDNERDAVEWMLKQTKGEDDKVVDKNIEELIKGFRGQRAQ